jgi:ABC-type branched-subunit amino acid transport system permease subunit
MPVAKPVIFGVPFEDDRRSTTPPVFLVLALWLTRNPSALADRARLIAIRDSEIAAQSMGVNLRSTNRWPSPTRRRR